MILKNGKRLDGMGDSMPIGSVVEYNGTDIPDGWEILPGDANVYMGSTQPTNGEDIWVKRNNNILPMKILSTTSNGITFTNNLDGSFNLSGTASAEANFTVDYILGKDIQLINGLTYTLGLNKNNSSQPLQVHVALFTYDGTWLKTPLVCSELRKTSVLDIPDNAYKVHLLIRVNQGYTIDLQNIIAHLEESDSIDEIEPYIEPKVLVKNGNEHYANLFNSRDLGHVGVSGLRSKNLFNIYGPVVAMGGTWGIALGNFISRDVLGETVTISIDRPVELIFFGENETTNRILERRWTNKMTFVVTEDLLALSWKRFLFFRYNSSWVNTKTAQLGYKLQSEIGTERTTYAEFCSLENHIYTPREQIIGVWIDGKPIYRSVIPVNFSTSGSQTRTNHGISNIGFVVNQRLVWFDVSDGSWFQSDKDAGINEYFVKIDQINSTQIIIKQNDYDWQSRTKDRYCIMEYTKTID